MQVSHKLTVKRLIAKNFRFGTIERALSIVAIISLAVLVFDVHSRGFLSLSADEFSKAVLAWDGLHNPMIWLDPIWLPGHFPLIAFMYLLVDDLLTASRLVSLLFGIVAVIGMYRLGHQVGLGWSGCLSAVLCATHPLVVWLSATGLVDILYAALFILGLSYYLEPQSKETLLQFYMSCSLFAVACLFHYNAWLAMAIISVSIGYDLLRGRGHARPHQFFGLCILGTIPALWFIWNFAWYGDPLYFWRMHITSVSPVLEIGGYHPSFKSAVYEVVQVILTYGTLLFALAVASAAGILTKGEKYKNELFLWLVLLTFGIGLVLLYARGGHPTAYSDRYLLLPLLLLAGLAAQALSRLLMSKDQYTSVLAALLLSATVIVQVWGTRQHSIAHERIQEAMELAEYFKHADLQEAKSRVLFESKRWNADALRVFLNRPEKIIHDWTIEPQEVQASILMRSEEDVRRFVVERGVRYIAVWSDKVRTHMHGWKLLLRGHIKSYTIYELEHSAALQE